LRVSGRAGEQALRGDSSPISSPSACIRARSQAAHSAFAEAGDLDRAGRLLALALSTDSPQVICWAEAVSRIFPAVLAGAAGAIVAAYTPGP
jgi:hypothetical protein